MGKYLDKIRQQEGTQPIETVKAAASPTIAAGSTIQWTRGDGSVQTGIMDFIHTDETGTRWAFVTIGKTWAAVNVKFVTVQA